MRTDCHVGRDRVVSSNSVLHETNGIDLSSLLVEQVSGLLGDQA